MNIFFLDKDPKLAAQYQCNKHVVKMILESAQLLSASHHLLGSPLAAQCYKLSHTHKSHPCTIWTQSHSGNYEWLYEHLLALGEEYTHRYGKQHKSLELAPVLSNNPVSKSGFTIPALVMPDFIKSTCNTNTVDDAVEAYRKYYNYKALSISMKWKNRHVPTWMPSFL